MRKLFLVLATCGMSAVSALAQESGPPVEHLDTGNWQHWTGLEISSNGAMLPATGVAVYRYPDGPRAYYKHGFRTLNDSAADWKNRYGLRLEVELSDECPVELAVTMRTAGANGADSLGEATGSRTALCGQGRHEVVLPWRAFGFEQARTSPLKYVKEISVAASFADGTPARVNLRGVGVIQAPAVALQAAVCGRAVSPGRTAEYLVTLSNCTDHPQAVSLAFVRRGWEAMRASVEPSTVTLPPGQSGVCTVRVQVPDTIPPGGHEEQTLQAIANGDAASASTLRFITAAELPHPYILHTPARWEEIRAKVRDYPWAKAAQDDYVQQATKWNVPEIARPPRNDPDDTMGPFLFSTAATENNLMACGIAWQLTRDRAFAEKVALFLRRLSDPSEGYSKTLRGCNQGLVQEGGYFQHIAMAYDMVLDSGVFSDADLRQIEAAFRVFLETMARANDGGAINNWNLAEVTGAFYVSLAMQNLASADRYFSGPGGIEDQLAKGTMDDGWWYECAVSYNVWCASEFTQAALAGEPFGFGFKDARVPASYARSVMLSAELSGGAPGADAESKGRPFGMTTELFGPLRRPSRSIVDLWNSLLPFLDYRGVMFGVNDSTERQIAGDPSFELAYYVYRDPAYAAIVKLGGSKRDLLYGVPELPATTPERFRDSAHADNVGLTMLRSQTPARPIREQIQAALHYGTHGWAHGHFDRTELLSLMRYGRSFWSPESVFYVYEPFMYKFYCQTSLNHNMVVVDEKMQEAAPGERLLFHTGKLMQAAAVQTTARWSNPPYGGMVYDYVPVKTFAEKTWREGRSVPTPEHLPKYGSLTDFTEPIRQRRLLVVTDDYIVLADAVRGTQPHTFENLFQLKGFDGLDAPQKRWLRHDAQWNPDPVGSAQFVTDADWYSAQAPAVARFTERWGPGIDEGGSRSVGNDPGVLKLDVHSVWPPSQEIMVAAAPEQHDVEKRLFYKVSGDGKTLADGKFGAWILGDARIDVAVEGVKTLALETRTELAKKPTLFWGDARIVMRDGREVLLRDLPTAVSSQNTVPGPARMDADYLGGPIKIAGNPYGTGVPAEPAKTGEPATVSVSLDGLDAVRFKAVLGSDYPPGPEAQRRKVYAVRAPDKTTSALFLTVIEPYEADPVVRNVQTTGADHLRVTLADGRVQEVNLSGLDGDGGNITVKITESRDGRVIREEDSAASATTP